MTKRHPRAVIAEAIASGQRSLSEIMEYLKEHGCTASDLTVRRLLSEDVKYGVYDRREVRRFSQHNGESRPLSISTIEFHPVNQTNLRGRA